MNGFLWQRDYLIVTFRILLRCLALSSTGLIFPAQLMAMQADDVTLATGSNPSSPDYLVTDPEIIVTARKRDELSECADGNPGLDDKIIEREGIRTVEDLAAGCTDLPLIRAAFWLIPGPRSAACNRNGGGLLSRSCWMDLQFCRVKTS
ncbi:MAG: hypothetical protein U5J78_07800 [Parasphingorhabdus sp.]|nr:hypothetical protein [Parasphingorhabdus sp.]